MTGRHNAFKCALLAGEPQLGLWTSLCSATVVELVAHAGFDWVVIDTEHAPNELPNVVEQLRALNGQRTAPIVRLAWNDMVLIKRLLDVGAQTLLVPFVQSKEEAIRAVQATRYPPHGVRGVAVLHRASAYGFDSDYPTHVHDELCLIVQLETQAALGELEAIAEVAGVDGLFIGPSDLAADMGYLGQPHHPEVQAAIADACQRCKRIGKPVGILAPVREDAQRFLDLGFSFVAVGSDLGLLKEASTALLTSFGRTTS